MFFSHTREPGFEEGFSWGRYINGVAGASGKARQKEIATLERVSVPDRENGMGIFSLKTE
jgi:hypothetical protein